MTETVEMTSGSEQYSRKSRQKGKRHRPNPNQITLNEQFRETLLPVRYGLVFLGSLLVSLLSVANPFLTGLANNIQSQNLYAGIAMVAGKSPYGDFFGTNGVLFYLLSFVSYLLKTSWTFAILQWIALAIAGIYFYKIVAYLSKKRDVADQLTVWFYLFTLAAGFGGIYASLFALPFLLTSIWFLIRYFENAVRDEAFIFYGVDAALVFMIYPKSALLWVVAFFVLIAFNVKRKQKARGVYQFLSALFGFLLIIYSVGYYTFIQQILGSAIQQTFLYNLALKFTYTGILWTLLIVAVALVVSGFLKNFIKTLVALGQEEHRYLKVTLVLAFLAQLVFIIGNENFDLSQLIILLPYGFIMAVLGMKQEANSEVDAVAPQTPAYHYLRANYFLPLLVCLAIPLQPILTYVQQGDMNKERTTVAAYIAANAEENATIYAWDNSAQIYLKSGHLSAGTILTATPYLNTKENQASLTFDLNKNTAQFIVVNNDLPLLDAVKTNLDKNYTVVEAGVSHFTIYQKK